MYDVFYSKQSIKALKKLPRNESSRIQGKIKQLAEHPYQHQQVKALKGSEGYRLRVGDWRVLYTINESRLEVWIIKIASRGEVYK